MFRFAVLVSSAALEDEDEAFAGMFVQVSEAAFRCWANLPPAQISDDDVHKLTKAIPGVVDVSDRSEWKGILLNVLLRSLTVLFVPNRDEDIGRRTKTPFPHELIGALLSCDTARRLAATDDELETLVAESSRLWDEEDASADEWPCAVHLSRMAEYAHGDVWSSSAAGSEVRPSCDPPARTAPT